MHDSKWAGSLLAVVLLAAACDASAQNFFDSDARQGADWVRWSLDEVHGPRVRLGKNVARRTLTTRRQLATFGIEMLPEGKGVERDSPLVIVIHGLNSSPDKTWGLLPPEALSQRWCGSFAYPNDQSLSASARQLSRELHRLEREAPGRSIVLVTHSMGGLIARDCLEDPELRPSAVNRLIMVAPPTHGSTLARLAISPDIWEHWLGRSEGSAWQRSIDATVDGFGEAASDLVPGSPYLKRLNRRERAPHVDYTLVLGTAGAGVREWQLSLVRAANRELAERENSAAPWCQLADELLGDLDELVCGRGDGAVAVKRGRLEGVEDTHLFDFVHGEVNRPAPAEVPTEVQRLIAQRLGLSADD
jgi:pimeloyl-ACP methyl ester carboxylesterase